MSFNLTGSISEALRKHPVCGFVARIATKDFNVPDMDIVIPKGMRVTIPIFAIHHDEKIYPNPEEFDPNRFSSDEIRDRPICSFLPFGDGK